MVSHEKEQFCSDDPQYDGRHSLCPRHVHVPDPRVEHVHPRLRDGRAGRGGVAGDGDHLAEDGGKAPIHLSGKTIGTALLGIAGALLLGVGMCLTMVWSNMVLGIVIGLVGIIALLCLIPLTKGLKS